MEMILEKFLAKWLGQDSIQVDVFGELRVSLSEEIRCANGQCWTLNGSEWRNGAGVCSLSSILETGEVDSRFYLSPKACAGILRRAEKREKQLPMRLKKALMAQAASTCKQSENMEQET